MMKDNSRKDRVSNLRLIFFGMLGELSRIPLATLLDAGLNVVSVVIPTSVLAPGGRPDSAPISPILPEPQPSSLSLLNPYLAPNTLHLAWQRQIPVFAAGGLDTAEVMAQVAALQPDVICVSCFSKRLPRAVLELPRYGCLNLHPSLLPDFRGPAPLFWTFQQGQSDTGVTVHFMDEGLDTGDIVRQARLALPDGISGARAAQLCGRRGGELLVEVVQALAWGQAARRPQPAGGSTYPWPAAADFTLDSRWPARRAFNFMRGTAEWKQPYGIAVAGRKLALARAVAYTAEGKLAKPAVTEGDDVFIEFRPGVLHAQIC